MKVYHPSPIYYLFFGTACIFLGIVISLATGVFEIFPALLAIGATIAIYGVVEKRLEKVIIEDTSIAYERGIFSITKTMVPYMNITHIKTRQTLLDRIMGLSALSIDTSGTSQTEIIVKDLPISTISKIVLELNKRCKRNAGN